MSNERNYEQFGLSFVAGYSDTLSFIALSGLFTAHVTGDVVLAAAQASGHGGHRAVSNLTMIGIFVVVIILITGATKSGWWGTRTVIFQVRALLGLEAVLLGGFWLLGDVFVSRHGFPLHRPVNVIPVAALGVAALAIQNALPSLLAIQRNPTTVMTGNLTRVATELASVALSWLYSPPSGGGGAGIRLSAMAPGVVGFALGAATAAPMTIWLHFNALALAWIVFVMTIPAATVAIAAST